MRASIRPGAIHLDDADVPRTVFDAKYKLASSTGEYANADHYQMLAYCTALRVPVAWLVYAGGGADIRRSIKHANVEVVAAAIDLRQTPDRILTRIDQIAKSAVQVQRDRHSPSQLANAV